VTLVIDASVIVKLFVPEEQSELAQELYGSGLHLVAPRLMWTEVANALARRTLQGSMKGTEATQHFEALLNYRIDSVDIDELIRPALQRACELRHPIYDLIYLETARRFSTQLITADRRFTNKLAGTDLAQHVTLLSDWQPA
jgi:predicted nucleic acid-binding protein